MGSNSSVLLQADIQAVSAETGFTQNQIKRLYSRFTSMDKDNKGYLTRQDFSRIPELHVNPLRDRIIDVLIDDHGSDDKVNFKQFAIVFSTFRRHHGKSSGDGSTETNSKENKLRFLFKMYDRDKDDRINKEELLSILNMLVGSNLPVEQMNALAERTIAELVVDSDSGQQNSITFKKFCETLKKIDIDDKMSMKFMS
jgi:calcineurin B family protein 1